MSGSNALQIADPNADNPLAQAPSWADAAQSVAGTVSSGVDALGQWLAAQRAKQQRPPVWLMSNPVGTETTRQPQQLTMPTPGVQDVAFWGGQPVSQQFKDTAQSAIGNALGWVGSAGPGEGGFSLEKVQRRPLAPPNEHIWKIKDPAGGDAGTIDTTWNPDTGNLHIEDFQSEGGPNTLGQAAIRQLRSALLDQYPGVQSLSGLRISGATYAHKPSGAGPGRYASQDVQ